jgi:hypothetical protein
MILSETVRPTGLKSMGSARTVELQLMTMSAVEARRVIVGNKEELGVFVVGFMGPFYDD